MSDSPEQRPAARYAPTRRHVLSGGVAAFALAALPLSRARAAGAETGAEPAEGKIVASLNGTWDFLPTTGTPTAPPEGGDWGTIPVPAEWNMTRGVFATGWDAYDLFETPAAWDDTEVAWYRRQVRVPARQHDQRIVLRFEAVNFESTVFWNGTQVAHNLEGTLPFEVDVTEHVNFGQDNTVHVLVRSPDTAARESDGFHHPVGSWWGQTCAGIWQDVWLIARPAVYVSDTTITTSVRDGELRATSVITNRGSATARVWVEHVVKNGGKTVLSNSQAISVPAGGTATASFTQAWSTPRLWSPDDPHLYSMLVYIRPTRTGAVGDTRTTRFGFREVWISGPTLYLNGAPIKLRGDAWHYMGSVENSRAYATAWFQMAKACGVNYIRLHAMPYPPVFYDVADELGMLIVAESAIYGSSGNYAMSADDFWDNCASHLTARTRRDINHPSVIAWSAENEMLAAFGQSYAGKVAALKPSVTDVDASRPVYFEGDGDPESAGDLRSTHYPLEITTSNTAIPDTAYALAPGEPRGSEWDRKKPFVISEFSSMYYATPSSVSAVGGPAAYADLDGFWAAHGMIVGAQIEGFRYAGISGVSPWNTVWYGLKPLPFDPRKERLPLPEPDGPRLARVGRWAATLNPGFQPNLPDFRPNGVHAATARTLQPTAALPTDYRTHYWAGRELTKTFAVYDEVGATRTVTLGWSLRLADGQHVTGRKDVEVPADGKADVTVGVPVPSVARATTGTLRVTVAAGGSTLFSDKRPVTAYPASAADRTSTEALAVAVLDAKDSTATGDAFTALGAKVRRITGLADLPSSPAEVLVIGEGAAPAPTADEAKAVMDFVEGGGTVVMFAQRSLPPLLPWPLVAAQTPQSIAHVAAPHHPVLAGLGADDLRWWHTDGELVASSAVVKPGYGSLTSLADVGPGLASSALAEAAYGSGTYLLCQLPVVSAAADEPVAAVLLRNIADYVAARKPAPRARLGVLAGTASDVPGTLDAAAVVHTAVTGVTADSLGDLDVLLVDASSADRDALATLGSGAAALGQWLSGGGVLWLNGTDPDTLPTLAPVLPAGVALSPIDSAHQFGAVVTGAATITDGLTNAALDWPGSPTPLVRYGVAAPSGTAAVDTRAVDWVAFAKGAEQNKYAIAAESMRGFVPTAAVWTHSSGSGQIVLDQLGWPTATPLPTQTGVVAALAANLGIGFDGGSGTGLLPTDDWTGFANPTNGQEAHAFDRDPSSRWSSDALQQPGMFYGVDLGAEHSITRIVMDDSLAPGDLPKGVEVQVSTDGDDYTTVLTVGDPSTITSAGVMTLVLDSVTARYVKIVDTAASPGSYYSVYELYVFAQ